MKPMPTTRWITILALAALLTAWGCPPDDEPGAGEYGFPHSDDFGDGPVHGPAWKTSPEGCDECHVQGKGGPDAWTCETCHEHYPHPEGTDNPVTHGLAWGAYADRCFACHGTGERRPAGVEDSACRDCHQDYPHRVTWALPGIHGPSVLAEGPEVCGTCHGEQYEGTLTTDGCIDCHEHFPHGEGYDEADTHGVVGTAENQHECSTSCHGTDLMGGSSEVACADCHEAYPHDRDYTGLAHREDLAALGEEECLACHTDGGGHPETFSCTTTCHGGGQ